MTALVEQADLDVLFLQEVYLGDMRSFGSRFDDGAFSLDVTRTDGYSSGKLGCAILSRRAVRLTTDTTRLVYELPQPERGLCVSAVWEGSPLRLLSWHAPNAAQHGRGFKEKAFRAIQAELASWTDPGLAGMDTNFPEDPLDLGAAEQADQRPDWRFHWDLLGAAPRHGLKDVMRSLVAREPHQATGPDEGPLATSHLAGQRPVRFDRILATPSFGVISVEHLLAEGVEAGSDHALVVADFGPL